MRVTIIFSDSTVYVDGEARHVVMPTHDPNFRAIQWYGDRGDVEVCVGAAFAIDDFSVVAPFLAAWEAAAPPPTPALAIGKPATGVEEM